MESRLYYAAIEGDSTYLQAQSMLVESQVTHDMNTVLHLASLVGLSECVRTILKMHPILLLKQNSAGETALHLAAREGHTDVVKELIDEAKHQQTQPLDQDLEAAEALSIKEIMIRMPNLLKDSALHEAARYNRVNVVKMLVGEDSQDSHYPNHNDETPLYIAAYKGYFNVVKLICEICTVPAYGGFDGRTVLHAAVIHHSNDDLIKYIVRWKEGLLKQSDDNGWTALHYAAYFGQSKIVSYLLQMDESVAYIGDNVGNRTALHIGVSKGCISVVEEIAKCCPDCFTMVDNRGRNVLHTAAYNNNKKMVELIIKSCRVISNLLNQKDTEGNTPYHLVAESGCFVTQMVEHEMIDREVFNDKHLTPMDALFSKEDELVGMFGFLWAVTTHKDKNITKDLWKENRGEIELKSKEKAEEIDRLKKTVQAQMIVATLIATVTFTAGFTVAGGFDGNAGPNQGRALLSRKPSFQAFIVTDTISFVLSTISMVMYFFGAVLKRHMEIKVFIVLPMLLNVIAVAAMMVSFITGTYTVLHPSALAIAVCIMACGYFGLHSFMDRIYGSTELLKRSVFQLI